MIDREGFRPNVGIILVRDDGRVFWARRIHRDGWQFPQGGLAANEGPHDAMLRELFEETGLNAEHVDVLGRTPGWLRYRLPKRYVRRNSKPVCIGQKQIWYLLHLKVDDAAVDLACNEKPEFDAFRWVNFWYPIRNVVPFKRQVYQRALAYLAPIAERHLEVRIRHRSRRRNKNSPKRAEQASNS